MGRIPKDKTLKAWINDLIANDNIVAFYASEDWKELRDDVLDHFHHECQECLKKGTYTKADCVHHVHEVRQHPEMALSKYYIDIEGNRQYNLVPLCNQCHNHVHDKLGEWQRKDKFSNEERW